MDDSHDEAFTIVSAHTQCDGVWRQLRKNVKFPSSTYPVELSESDASPPAKTGITDAPAKVVQMISKPIQTQAAQTRLQGRLSTTLEQEYP